MPAYITSEPATYRRPTDDPHGPSFFRDLRNARVGDVEAAQRLARNEAEFYGTAETRALSTGTSAGGTFAPPLWLVDDFITAARPGRVTADRLTKDLLPAGVSSLNLPKIATGAATAVQASQNTTLQQTDLTTSFVTGVPVTIGGKQVVSQQLIDQSGIPFDEVILRDLAADYSRQLNAQVETGTGTAGQLPGLLGLAGANAIAFTTATPKVTDTTPANSFYNAVVKAANAVHIARFLPATAIVMHPTRWAWILEALDTTTRPLVPAGGSAFNSVGSVNGDIAEGAAGTFANLPVYLSATLPTNLGAGTNQDQVLVLRGEDTWLYESELRFESFTAPYADSAGVLFRVLGYSAMLPRYAGSISVIGGSGLIAPTL